MVELEKLGTPTVSITSHGFETDFVESVKVFGLPGLRQVIIPYTLTSRKPEQAEGDAEAAFNEIVRALTTPLSGVPTSKPDTIKQAERETFSGTTELEAERTFNKEYIERGWSDGFPLVAPTPPLVDSFLKAVAERWSPLDVVGNPVAPGDGIATIEKIAINAAMAGCEPAHMPVLISALEAATQTANLTFNLRWLSMSHAPHFIVMLVNGPITEKLGMGSGQAFLGPGKLGQVNTVLGRALRLIMMNVGHCYPGISDLDSIGSPNKYSFCVAENQENNPWEPWHVERGFRPDQSVVTLFGGSSVSGFGGYTPDASKLLQSWNNRLGGGGGVFFTEVLGIPRRAEISDGSGSGTFSILGQDFARSLADAGYTRKSIKQYLIDNARGVRLADALAIPGTDPESFPEEARRKIDEMDPNTIIKVERRPEQIQFVVAGGPSAAGEIVSFSHMSVTKEIEV